MLKLKPASRAGRSLSDISRSAFSVAAIYATGATLAYLLPLVDQPGIGIMVAVSTAPLIEQGLGQILGAAADEMVAKATQNTLLFACCGRESFDRNRRSALCR